MIFTVMTLRTLQGLSLLAAILASLGGLVIKMRRRPLKVVTVQTVPRMSFRPHVA